MWPKEASDIETVVGIPDEEAPEDEVLEPEVPPVVPELPPCSR